MAGAVSLASVLGLVSPASAATDLKGKDPFNTDKLLMSICTGSTARSYWFINVNTGMVAKDVARGFQSNPSMPHPTERFQGWCSYPQASSWTWTGSETKTSDTLINCSTGSQLAQAVQSTGTTTSTTVNSVGGSFGVDWSILPEVLSTQATFTYEHQWSYAKAKGWSKTTTLTVPARRVGWVTLRPLMRTVRVNPIFHVEKYTYGTTNGGTWTVNSWRGRGYKDIKSYGAFYDAKANVTDSNGNPLGQSIVRDRAVNSSDRC
ncbi:hypothetical protein [Streptomyces sp. yr375]|uniref:hypothetical protein n=1 Tax=Streptomyces sp. yr375 TaxID=1761906 RepID=UPI000B84A2B7|nr:hypothetical protein [Streptomyces sp. yr375]